MSRLKIPLLVALPGTASGVRSNMLVLGSNVSLILRDLYKWFDARHGSQSNSIYFLIRYAQTKINLFITYTSGIEYPVSILKLILSTLNYLTLDPSARTAAFYC